MKYLQILLIIVITITSCSSEKQNTHNDTENIKSVRHGIILSKNTSMRINPYIFSSKIKHLQKGDKIIILGNSSKKSWIGKSNAYWYQVTDNQSFKGWVYGSNIKIMKSSGEEEISRYLNTFWAKQNEVTRIPGDATYIPSDGGYFWFDDTGSIWLKD